MKGGKDLYIPASFKGGKKFLPPNYINPRNMLKLKIIRYCLGLKYFIFI